MSDVAASTRARVLAEAERLSYRPNQAARRLRRGRSEAVGVVLPGAPGQFDDPFFLRMLGAIGPLLDRARLDLLVTTARPGADEMRAYRHLGRRAAASTASCWPAPAATTSGFPTCWTARCRSSRMAAPTRSRRFAFVDVDGAAACRAATERLLGFGHTRIGPDQRRRHLHVLAFP